MMLLVWSFSDELDKAVVHVLWLTGCMRSMLFNGNCGMGVYLLYYPVWGVVTFNMPRTKNMFRITLQK